jgi:hypothetical protein
MLIKTEEHVMLAGGTDKRPFKASALRPRHSGRV